MANEFLVNRIVKADFNISKTDVAQTLSGGAYVPHGALVTGVTFMQTSGTIGSAHTAISQTLHVGVGAVTVNSTAYVKNIGSSGAAYFRAAAPALLTAGGVYVTTDTVYNGEIMMTLGATANNSNLTFSPSVFVGYVI